MPLPAMVLTEKGKRAEARLERLMRRREKFGNHLTGLTGADARDRVDEQIDRIEGNFADTYADPTAHGYWRIVKEHPRKGTRGVKRHIRRSRDHSVIRGWPDLKRPVNL